MPFIGAHTDISRFIDAIVAGDSKALEAEVRDGVHRAEDAYALLGRVGEIAARGDSDGHTVLLLNAASMLCRWLIALRHVLDEEAHETTLGIPLTVQALMAAAPAVKAGNAAQTTYPEPLFPSGLAEGETVNSAMQKAVFGNDPVLVERLLFGLFGTGADYRALLIRIYDGISTTFQNNGHPLLFAVRGSQLLDATEWSDRVPAMLHWLAPHLPVHTEEPGWTETIRVFLGDPHHSLDSYRTRLAAPREEQALPLRSLILSDTGAPQICQGVYEALMKNGASARGIGSVIALAATDLIQRVSDDDRDAFVHAAHGLLYTAAARLVFTQVQEVEALPLLFTAACYINALHNNLPATTGTRAAQTQRAARAVPLGGGLIAPSLLDTLHEQLDAQDIAGAFATARRYSQLGHDRRALFATIGLAAANTNLTADAGHTLQIVQAAGEEFMAWPATLSETNIEGFLHVALRAVAFAKRNEPANA